MNARSAPSRNFGVEEEYLLLDAETGMPRDCSDDLIRALEGVRAEHEFFQSQLETATAICRSGDEALRSLLGFREAASRAAAGEGVVLAGTGMPPLGGTLPGSVVGKRRYLSIVEAMRGMVARYYPTGAHVHAEVPSRDAGVDVIGRIARWAPVLLALTANSPIWLGEESGYASWRYMSMQQWPTAGYPPLFEDGADYDRVVEGLVRCGAVLDAGVVNWTIRLSQRFPTVEIRLADAQLDAEDAVAFALIFRGLVDRGLREHELGEARAAAQPDLLRGAHWVAARNGLTGELFDPFADEPLPAFDYVDALLQHISAELRDPDDAGIVERFIGRRRADRGPAQRQLLAWEHGGISALLDLYRAS